MIQVYGCLILMLSVSMAYTANFPMITLNNGQKMPGIALGTFLGYNERGLIKSENKRLRYTALRAIELGYRHFDTASIYDTEAELGEAINKAIADRAVERKDVFVTTKLWNTQHRQDLVTLAIDDSLKRMNLTYVDLYLMHWPLGLHYNYSFADVDYMEAWRGMEDQVLMGAAKSIGVCNFNKEQLQRLIAECKVKPAVLQIEVHPQLTQDDLVAYAQSQGITVMAYTPFGAFVQRNGIWEETRGQAAYAEVAKKYQKTVPHIALRWLVDRNIVPIPKSVNVDRLRRNIDIFDFKLTPEEVKLLGSFNENKRYTAPTFWQTHRYYPFEKVDDPMADPFAQGAI